jgi:NAD(P)-dependent dehydrogenase (short-subunit alcohol dehydrogenase family)
MGWLEGDIASVTGGGSGIGHAMVARFIEEGARVGVLERVADRVDQLQADFGKAVMAIQGDVTKIEDNKRAVEATLSAFGQLDIFVGNAGVFDNFLPLADFPEDTLGKAGHSQFAGPGWEERLRTNNPLQLALHPDDIAGAYAFLASKANAKGITGVIMTIDAGSTLRMPRRS